MYKIIIIVVIVTIVGLIAVSNIDKAINGNGTQTGNSANFDDEDAITVTISGEVVRPGTYTVAEGTTLGQLIGAASGTTSNADPLCYYEDYVCLAQMSFYISPIYDNSDTCAVTPIAKVNINVDDSKTLQTISGIGEAIADAIVRYRESTALFRRIEDIKNVSGIGDATFTRIRDHIRLKDPSA